MDCGFSELLLKTTDRQIDLLALNKGASGGIGVDDYTPGRPNFKGGGVWQDGPIATGRRPVFGVRGNVVDALTIKIAGKSHRSVIESQNALDEMLEQAMAYWLQDTGIDPVWIVARAAGETERRYAIVYGYSFAEYDDPYSEPYLSGTGHVLNDLTLGLERSAWQHLPPFGMEEIPIYNLKAPWNSGSSAKPETPVTGGLYIASGYPITDHLRVYRYDASAGSYTQITTYPSTIFPDPMGVGDILYIRSDVPITSLYWPYEQGVPPDASIWEYYDGSNWKPLESLRNGYLFSIATVPQRDTVVTRWLMPPDWATVAPSAGDGLTSDFYIRIRILTAAAGTPQSFASAPYMVSQPYVQFDGAEVGGDLDALAAIEIYLDGVMVVNEDDDPDLRISSDFGRMIVGARSVYRDGPAPDHDRFHAYIPCNQFWQTLYGGITITYPSSGGGGLTTAPADVANSYATGGYAARWTSNAADTTLKDAIWIDFDKDAVPWYSGTFRLFVRAKTLDTSTFTADAQLRYRLELRSPGVFPIPFNTYLGETISTQLINPETTSGWQLIDLGRIQIPPGGGFSNDESLYMVRIALEVLIEPSKDISVNDFILMPVDEWAADTSADRNIYNISTTFGGGMDDLKKWTIDSVQNPKEFIRANVFEYDGSIGDRAWRGVGSTPVIANKEASLRANTEQRLWFLFESLNKGNENFTPEGRALPNVINWANRVRLYKLQRYHFLRGDD